MFASVLIANRGEIACRVARTAHRMGLRVIAVYSRADRDAPHVRLADEAYEIGPAPAALSYLDGARILEAARASGAQCLHPGYGFLSENAAFAEACAAAGVTFVGPPPAAIRAMGLKDEAKALMRRAGVPVAPGYDGDAQDLEHLQRAAETIGFPVLIKAVAGGGGKGMRRVDDAASFADALDGARREARSAFGNDRVLIEKYIAAPRHIEVQVFGDAHGRVVHLFERDCSLQRRHQKVIEEAPAPGMSAALRARMGEAACAAARAVGYVGAGTVEFIVDGSRGLREDGFFFMEMNTRLQVEHPVTEAITGLDLVEWQLRVAAGEPLPRAQTEIALRGHAMEARLYAEDPAHDFLPSTGRILAFTPPDGDGVRVDAGVEAGGEVTPFYDPMIAKIIAHGADREEARLRLQQALEDTRFAGPRTNLRFLHDVLDAPDFVAGVMDTGLIARDFSAPAAPEPVDPADVRLAALALLRAQWERLEARVWRSGGDGRTPFDDADGFQASGVRRHILALDVQGRRHDVTVVWPEPRLRARDGVHVEYDGGRSDFGDYRVADDDGRLVDDAGEGAVIVFGAGAPLVARLFDAGADAGEHGGDHDGAIRSPMHGKVVALLVEEGQQVKRGARLAIVEAMKMEHVLVAPRDGRVTGVAVAQGAQAALGARLMSVAGEDAQEAQGKQDPGAA